MLKDVKGQLGFSNHDRCVSHAEKAHRDPVFFSRFHAGKTGIVFFLLRNTYELGYNWYNPKTMMTFIQLLWKAISPLDVRRVPIRVSVDICSIPHPRHSTMGRIETVTTGIPHSDGAGGTGRCGRSAGRCGRWGRGGVLQGRFSSQGTSGDITRPVSFNSLRIWTWPSRNSGFSHEKNGGSFQSFLYVYQRVPAKKARISPAQGFTLCLWCFMVILSHGNPKIFHILGIRKFRWMTPNIGMESNF